MAEIRTQARPLRIKRLFFFAFRAFPPFFQSLADQTVCKRIVDLLILVFLVSAL